MLSLKYFNVDPAKTNLFLEQIFNLIFEQRYIGNKNNIKNKIEYAEIFEKLEINKIISPILSITSCNKMKKGKKP